MRPLCIRGLRELIGEMKVLVVVVICYDHQFQMQHNGFIAFLICRSVIHKDPWICDSSLSDHYTINLTS